MPPLLRIVTWNCRSGPVSKRLSQLAPYSPDLIFLQECEPVAAHPFVGAICSRKVNDRKGISLIAPSLQYQCRPLRLNAASARAALAMRMTGALSFSVLTFRKLGLVSAYHAFHHVEHGEDAHATYFHQFNASRPWHIDFCFVPEGWTGRLANVTVLDGQDWSKRSDHRPLLVEIQSE